MTQLLDPSGPFACVWDETIDGCEIPEVTLIDTSGYAHPPECTISNFCDTTPPAPVPLPGSVILLLLAIVLLFTVKYLGHKRGSP